MKKKLLLFSLLIGSLCTRAQQYSFKHYKIENGLSNNSVFCCVQDKTGFMWFGTKDGLNRFDGYAFKVFRNDPDDAKSIGNNFILSLAEDKQGVLWAGSSNGLYWYDAATESFHLLRGTNNEIRDIETDKDGNLWFMAGSTLHKYNRQKKTHRSYPPAQFFNASSICTSPNGTIWVASDNGIINRYNPQHDAFDSFPISQESKQKVPGWLEEIYALTDTTFFIGTSNEGIRIFNVRSAAYENVLTYNSDRTGIFIRDIIKNNDQEYWIATESGIFVYNINTKTATNLKNVFGDAYSISDNAVYKLHKDKEGGIWAGTYFGGANYYSPQFNSFQKVYPTINHNSIDGNVIRAFCEDQYGNIWIGTEDAGLNKYNRKTCVYTHFKPTGAPNSIAYSNIHGLLAYGNELWIGTFQHGLDVMDIRTGNVIRHYDASNKEFSLKDNFIHDIYLTRAGMILVATVRGLYQYNRAHDNFLTITSFPNELFYTKILERSDGTLWAGTYRDGVYYYNPVTKEQGYFKNEPYNKNSLNGNRINDIFEDGDRNLWLATENGFCKFDHATRTFKRYTTKEGLPSNVTYGIQQDNNKKLWISTSKGLIRFNPADGKMIVYTKSNGLLSDQFNYNSSYKDASGKLYFGNVAGYICFDPAGFHVNNFVPPVLITAFQVNNSELAANRENSPLKRSISYTKEITLKHNQSSFAIDFAALSYIAPEATTFAYMLEGLDKEWTYLTTNRKVYFTDLSPGTYTFKVKAAIFGGEWSKEATTLTIEILPPFWATWWAKCLYALLILLLSYYLIRSYHHTIEEKKEKEIYEAKIDFFTNVAHEIKTPLTLIRGPVDYLMEIKDELPQLKNIVGLMKKNTERLLNLTTQILDFRQLEIKGFSLDFSKVNINKLVSDNFESFKLLAANQNLDFTLKLPKEEIYASADEEALNKILSNLISNAIKYADHSVKMKLHPIITTDGFATIEIANDGLPIPNDMKEKIFEPFFRLKENKRQKGTGIGLSIARSLAQLHKGKLYVKDNDSGLNTFILKLPLHPDNYLVFKKNKTIK